MKRRRYNPNERGYKNYGGRGISVCALWRANTVAFVEWGLANGWKPALTIERIDVNGNYCPENCRFATHKEQANNTRRTIRVTAFGETKSLSDWMNDPRTARIERNTIAHRIKKLGLDPEIALTLPSQRAKKPPKPKVVRERKPKYIPHPRPRQTVTAFGETKTYAQWQDDPRCHCCRSHIYARVKNGWTPEQAISLPAGSTLLV
jgi:hypothetical protein